MDLMVSRDVPANRALTALLLIGIAGVTLAIVFAIIGQAEINRTHGEADGLVQFIWGGIFAAVGVPAMLLWLTVRALRWRP